MAGVLLPYGFVGLLLTSWYAYTHHFKTKWATSFEFWLPIFVFGAGPVCFFYVVVILVALAVEGDLGPDAGIQGGFIMPAGLHVVVLIEVNLRIYKGMVPAAYVCKA